MRKDCKQATLEDYYRLLSSDEKVESIKIPLLSINSMDDPIIDATTVPLKKIIENENIIQININGGGHISYFANISHRRMWAFDLSLEYFREMHKLLEKDQ